jgi:hypothetical protein
MVNEHTLPLVLVQPAQWSTSNPGAGVAVNVKVWFRFPQKLGGLTVP